MKARRRSHRFPRTAALVFVAAVFIVAGAGTALDPSPGEWVLTPEARARTATGECGTGLCKEWCLNGQPSGDFMCFAY